MSTTKNVTTLIKKSVVASTVPTTSNLVIGELAVNHADGKLYAVHTTSGVVDGVTLLNPAGGGGSFDGSNVSITGGSISGVTLSTPGDIVVNGMTIGLGSGQNGNNVSFGKDALTNLIPDPGDYTTSFNVAIGQGALQSLTHASNDLAVGALSLNEATTGGFNMAFGAHALQKLTTGNSNIAIGFAAGGGGFSGTKADLTTGSNNIYIGSDLYPPISNEANTLRVLGSNICIGTNAASLNQGAQTIAIGQNAYQNGVFSQNNICIGQSAGLALSGTVTAGGFVVGVGYRIVTTGTTDFTTVGAANSNVGTNFTATGVGTGTGTASPTAADKNVIIGQNAGFRSITGQRNTVVGRSALQYNVNGHSNTAIGQASFAYTVGSNSVSIGRGANAFTGGSESVGIGTYALSKEGNAQAGYFEVGQTYIISDTQNTNFTLIGAANNNDGTIFTATGVGTGNGTAALQNTAYGNRNIGIGYRAGAGATSTGEANKGNDNIYIGRQTAPLVKTDGNCIVIGNSVTGIGANAIVIGDPTVHTVTQLAGDVKAVSGNLVLPSTTNYGIKVNVSTPAWGWRDITASMKARSAGSTDPSFVQYAGTSLYAYRFSNSLTQEVFIEFHVPHDYVPGTDMFIHTHWSQTTADAGTAVKWSYDVLYAKGHQQAAFPSSVTTVSATQDASSTVRQHMIAETQLSTSGQIGGSPIEVDGVILVRMYRNPADAADTLTVPPFAHFCDIHYQSTNMATAGKAPSFY